MPISPTQQTTENSSLVGAAEAAWILGVTTQRLAEIRKNIRFPEPIARLKCGPIWRREDVEKFKAGYRKRGAPLSGT